jgi:uncharacterized protein (TIGR03086 family)
MNQLELLQASTALTQQLVERTDFDEATMKRPTPCSEFDVAALVEHIIGTHHFLLSAAGGTADDTGSIADRHRTVADQSQRTWAERGAAGTVDLGGHQLPAEVALSLHALEAFVHGWDLAASLNQPFEPSPELVDVAWESARMIVSDDKRSSEPGAPYGLAVTITEPASPLDALIAFTGRNRWNA